MTRGEFLGAGAALGAALLLPGCGGGGSADGELTFWNGFTGGDAPTMLELIDSFTKDRPETSIRMVSVRWEDFYTKVPAAVRTGRGPDLAIMHVDQIATNAAHQVLRPLDDVAQELGLQEDDFGAEVWRAGVVGGKRYSIPLDMHPLGFYSNGAVLKKAGLDPEKPPTDRASFEQALDALEEQGIQGNWVTPFFFTGGLMFQSLLWQFGGELFDQDAQRATWNSDAGVESIEYLRSWVEKGWSPGNVAQDADNVAFKGGAAAFIWQGAWGVADYGATDGLEWKLSPLPKIGDERAAWSNSHQFAVMRTMPENQLPVATAFIDHVTKAPEWANAGMVPARRSARESEAFKKLDTAPLAEQVPYVRFSPSVPGISDVRESTLDLALQQALSGGMSAREALDSSAKRANELMAANREAYPV